MEQPIRTLIVEDHRLFAEAIAALLREHEDILLVELISNPVEALDKTKLSSLDVVIISATLQNIDTLEFIQQIKDEHPGLNLILLGLDESEEVILTFIEAGANGYVVKEAFFEELLHTIRAVYKRQTLCSPRIAATVLARVSELARDQNRKSPGKIVKLTPRETKVLELIAKGLSNKEIASGLNISLATVKNHVHNILGKLNVNHRLDAIRLAYNIGVLTKPHLYRWQTTTF